MAFKDEYGRDRYVSVKKPEIKSPFKTSVTTAPLDYVDEKLEPTAEDICDAVLSSPHALHESTF